MTLKLATLYSQRNSAWANTFLGYNSAQPYTIGNFGCKLTCLAMYAKAIGKDENPATLNEKLKSTNQFENGGELNSDNCFNVVFGDVNLKYQSRKYEDLVPDSVLDTARNLLDSGFILFAEIDFNPATVNEDMHFVLIIGYEGDKWIIADPWTGTKTTLDVYGDVKRVLYRIFCYDKTVAKDEATVAVPVSVNENNVKKATQWDKTTAKYMPDKDPSNALFEDLQSVVAGYLSLATTAQTKANDLETKLKLSEQEVINLQDKVANVKADCQKQYDLLEASYNALKDSAPTVEKLRGQYEGTIAELQGTIRELQKTGGLKDKEIVALKTQIDQLQKNNAKTYKVGELLTLIWQKVKSLDIKLK